MFIWIRNISLTLLCFGTRISWPYWLEAMWQLMSSNHNDFRRHVTDIFKLVSNLKLQLHHGETSAHHVNHHRRQAPEQTKDSSTVQPDSTDDDLQHTFWQRVHQKVKPLKYSGPRAQESRPHANSGATVALAGGPAMTPSSVANPSHALQPGGHAAGVQPFLGYSRNAVAPYHSSQAAPPPPAPRPHSHSPNSPRPGGGRSHRYGHGTVPASTRNPTTPGESQRNRNFSNVPQHYHSQPQFCPLCHGAGHTAVTCGSRESECYKCRQKGHLARACTQL